MESAASEIMTYEAQLVPDLLQTDELRPCHRRRRAR